MRSVLAVGALDADGRPLEASNWGAPYRENGLLAPGQDLSVALPGEGVSTSSGTSFATAVVSGVAGLLLSAAQREEYKLDVIDIRSILLESASPCEGEVPGTCDRYLAGTLNAGAALTMLHRVGRASRPIFRIPPIDSDIRVARKPTEPTTTGVALMSSVNSMLKEASTSRPSAVLPSTCDCERRAAVEEMPVPATTQSETLCVIPQACSCGGGKQPCSCGSDEKQTCACGGRQALQIIYAIGALWFDFGTEARYDALVQQLGDPVQVNTPPALFAFIRENLQFAPGVTFILMQDQIPIYAIQPSGPFAQEVYRALLDALESAIEAAGSEQRVSIPGYVAGSVRLMNGMTVPVVYPDLRGMYKWRSEHLLVATRETEGNVEHADEDILNFLNRVYYELRNLGVAPQERALNYAATNAYQNRRVFADATARKYELDSIRVVRSPICRPDSDCWDVQVQVFDPENERRAARIYRYTVDVSEVIPVTVGPVRQWAARLGSL
jgi:cyanobactin maturation PatA/PatG family protease